MIDRLFGKIKSSCLLFFKLQNRRMCVELGKVYDFEATILKMLPVYRHRQHTDVDVIDVEMLDISALLVFICFSTYLQFSTVLSTLY